MLSSLIQRIDYEITKPFEFEGQEIDLGASIGFSRFHEDGIEMDVLMKKQIIHVSTMVIYHAEEAAVMSGKYGANRDQFEKEVMNLMVPIDGGTVELRDYINTNKWLSSDYTLSDPGRGSDRKVVTWTETIEPFYVMKYPVTRQLYQLVMHEEVAEPNGDNLPITAVSWRDSLIFCNTLSRILDRDECYTITEESENTIYNKEANGLRLLTDAEWQYACKAGTKGYRYGTIDKIAWYQENSNGSAQPVGQLLPNPWGLYDMVGNVWEWCWDLYDKERYGDYRVFRGGSWAEVENNCGSTIRRKSMPNLKIDDLGFRIACGR